MRWACRIARGACSARTNNSGTHGQVARSWPPDAEVKFAMVRFAYRADDGGQQARRTEENAKQPLKPLRGEGRAADSIGRRNTP